jgi:apolipoprotein N-acyltransferase
MVKIENVWDAMSVVIALLFSVILWFSWLGEQVYTVPDAINTTISWLIGVIILVVGANIIGFSGDKVKKTLDYEGADIWEAIAAIVGVLLTIILWFSWLGQQSYTVSSVITTAIVWIVVVLVLELGALFIGYFQETLKTSLE